MFKVEQGFQRNTSEIYIRQLSQAQVLERGALPSSSSLELERERMNALAEYLADATEKPAYSYVARGISAQHKMRELHDDAGVKSLLLEVSSQRAMASTLGALERGQFKVIDQDSKGFNVQYYPLLSDSDKPGFWGRLFGKDPAAYDEAVPYAGEFYRINIQPQAEGLKLTVQPVSDKVDSARNRRNEINQIVQIIRGYLS